MNRSKPKIILASRSPRRIQLLDMIGIEAEAHPSVLPEEADTDNPEELVLALSRQKAEDIAELYPDCTVIGADTVVSIDGSILGKPKDIKDACDMLRLLSGRTHQVYTGVTVISGKEFRQFAEESSVELCKLENDEIWDYVRSGEPLDKAGSYGIQGPFAKHVRAIVGDYYNVVGLPLSRLYSLLKQMELI